LPLPIRERSLQRDARASLWLDACLGNFFVRLRIFRFAATRDLRRNVTMRAADECHPLPDQLHPCSRFSWFSSIRILRLNRSQKDRCVSRRLRSLQRGTLFLQFREMLVPEARMSLRLSCFVTRLCASLRFFERLTSLERRIRDHFVRAAREGCASVMIRNQVP